MTLCQTIALDFDEEMKNTRKLLERVPVNDALRNYAPHEKSMTLDRLATHVAELPGWLKMALEADIFDLPADFKPVIASSTEELLKMFDEAVAGSRAAIDAAPDDIMSRTWTFSFAGDPVFSAPRSEVIRSFINHLVHHRAQLGVYLRLNNIPVPGMYGPSADDGWPPAA